MGVSVRLAGYNLDADLLAEATDLLSRLEQGTADLEPGKYDSESCRALLSSLAEDLRNKLDLSSFTPETLSAAYARISRDPNPVTELRKAARFGVARARKSNESIIFGLGHASVAEHACFNFDVLGLSRLAAEELQSHRLLSFTEKSQRYITLSTDYVLPPELAGSDEERLFHDSIPLLFRRYDELCQALTTNYLGSKAASKQETAEAENRAKEDARYLLPLATTTQMGMTANARMIEYVIRDLSDHPLEELRNLGKALYGAVQSLAPSLVKYTSRGSYPRENRETLLRQAQKLNEGPVSDSLSAPKVRLTGATPDGEACVLNAFLFSSGSNREAKPGAANLWKEIFHSMGEHDGAPREFELASMSFEAVISASCFAQLKRHRMMTLITSPYSLDDGVIVPPSIADAGLEGLFVEATNLARNAATKLYGKRPRLAAYLLTNAQQRRVLMQMNAREFYHFARLRADSHAQWEIRMLAEQMLEQARKLWPNLFLLACGKDRFAETYRSLYS